MEQSPKKIQLTFAINDMTMGGAQKLVIDLCNFLDRDAFDITLISFFKLEGKKDLSQDIPSHVTYVPFSFAGTSDTASWKALYAHLKKNKPDIVVSHLFFSNFVMRVLKPIVGYKIAVVEHNTYLTKTFKHILADKLLSFVTSKIVAVSDAVATYASSQAFISRSKFVTIHNGIDLDAVRAKLPERTHSQEKIILNVARLTPQKNHALLITGFAAWKNQYTMPDHKLVIVGYGDLQNELQEQVAAQGMQESISLVGFQDPFPWYAKSDFFISTSTIEGMSIAYIEALASGLPLLVTKTAGTEDLVHEKYNGVFIQQPTISAVVEGLQTMISLNGTELRNNAIQFSENFSVKKTSAQYQSLIYSILNS